MIRRPSNSAPPPSKPINTLFETRSLVTSGHLHGFTILIGRDFIIRIFPVSMHEPVPEPVPAPVPTPVAAPAPGPPAPPVAAAFPPVETPAARPADARPPASAPSSAGGKTATNRASRPPFRDGVLLAGAASALLDRAASPSTVSHRRCRSSVGPRRSIHSAHSRGVPALGLPSHGRCRIATRRLEAVAPSC